MMNRMNVHWAFQYMGKPWVSGAQGPEAYDCWGLVRAVQREQYGLNLPIVQIDATDTSAIKAAFHHHPEFVHWEQVQDPQEGDCVITKSSPDHAEHIGVWINVGSGRVLQCVYGAGVIAISLEATRRMIGQHIEFWRHRGDL